MRTYNENLELAQRSLETIKERIKELEKALKEQRALARSFKNFIEKWSQKPDLPPLPTISTKTE